MRFPLAIALMAFVFSASAQKVLPVEALAPADTVKSATIDPLRPAKAAFFSAILPGMGQVYNKRYWKVPVVYGAIGTSMYFYLDSNKKYKRYRNELKQRFAGYGDPDLAYLDDDRLINVQKLYRKNREYSMLFVGLFYILQIVEANIDAHLKQFNVSDDLTLAPDVYQSDIQSKPNVGLTLSYTF